MFFRKKAKAKKEGMGELIGNTSSFGEPLNALEEKIVLFHERKIDAEAFVVFFLKSTAYVIAKEGDFDVKERKLLPNPSFFSITYPEHTCLCFYSHKDRIAPTREQYPEFNCAILICPGELMHSITILGGLALNPFWNTNMEWNTQQTSAIKSLWEQIITS